LNEKLAPGELQSVSMEGLELERDGMLIELLAIRAKGEKAAHTAVAGAGTTARIE
jgi:hypothetical protein